VGGERPDGRSEHTNSCRLESATDIRGCYQINDRGEIAGFGVPPGVPPEDYETKGHAYVLIPDGDCDDDCEARIAASRTSAAPAQYPTTMRRRGETPVDRVNQPMWRRHLPGQTTTPRD
jgi:hypothetical protein